MKVLIVDDSGGTREMLKLMLESMGHEVVGEVDNGNDVMKAFRSLRPEVVMLDIILPGKSGLDVLDEIQALEPAARVIVLTAVDQEDMNQRIITAGAPIVYKPFSGLDLEKAFRRLP